MRALLLCLVLVGGGLAIAPTASACPLTDPGCAVGLFLGCHSFPGENASPVGTTSDGQNQYVFEPSGFDIFSLEWYGNWVPVYCAAVCHDYTHSPLCP